MQLLNGFGLWRKDKFEVVCLFDSSDPDGATPIGLDKTLANVTAYWPSELQLWHMWNCFFMDVLPY